MNTSSSKQLKYHTIHPLWSQATCYHHHTFKIVSTLGKKWKEKRRPQSDFNDTDTL